MSAVEELSIVLQHDIDEQYQYQPGEVVRGVIEIRLSRPTSLRSITAKIYGEGNVSWQDENNKSQTYQALEVYVDAAKAIVDTASHEPLSLPKGRHAFQLDYLLPNDIPSSYIGRYGSVTYTMRVTVTGVKSADTSITSEPFLVIRRSPLPEKSLQPIKLEASKRLCSLCTFGKLYVSVSLDKQGGIPGDDLFLNVEIKNHSRVTVTAMQASLILSSSFRAQNKSISNQQIVSKKRDEFDIGHMQGRRWTFIRLTIPPYVPESKLDHCDIIEVDYSFQFRVEMSGGREIKLEAPIWISPQPQGLEIPADRKTGLKINRNWTVKGEKHMVSGGDDGGFVMQGLNYDDGWGVEVVPEMRSESAVVTNPLFKQNGASKKQIKIVSERIVENTHL